MTTKVFEYRKDDEYGSDGWVLENAPKEFNTGNGRLVAHDCLEHFWDGKVDRWEDELLALGAMTFIRYETGEFSSNYNPKLSDNLSGDLVNCLYFIINERGIKPIKTKKLDCEHLEMEFFNAVHLAKRELDREDVAKIEVSQVFNIVGWLRKGYRRAQKRFGDNFKALTMFRDIEREVDRLTKFADIGDRLLVSFNIRRCTTKVTFLEQTYYEW